MWLAATVPGAGASLAEQDVAAVSASQVRVTADFPGGNACAIEVRPADDLYEIRFAADPRGGTEALWFYFRVSAPPGQKLRPILRNPDTLLGGRGDWSRVSPVARDIGADGNPTGLWRRVEPGTMRQLADGRTEVVWTVVSSTGVLEFAFCFPYSKAELEQTLEACGNYWRADTIGVSSRGRPLTRLSNTYGDAERSRPGIYLMARQHAGETPGSWVLDGLLRAAVTEIPPTELVVWVVPFANIDGVEEGEYGKDPHPIDLNRDWASPLPLRYETGVLRADIDRFSRLVRFVAAVDFHAPGAREGEGAYFQVLKPSPEHAEAIRMFVDHLVPSLPAELLAREPLRLATYGSRWNEHGTFGKYLWNRYRIPAPALETPYSRARDHVLDVEDYRRLGAALAHALKNFAQSTSQVR